MKSLPILLFLLLPIAPLTAADRDDSGKVIQRITFGSCYRPGRNPEIWNTIRETKPDLFLFLGDNIYADTTEPEIFRTKYDALLGEKAFQNLREEVELMATWDDHDYGKNDAGREYPAKDLAKKEFLRAFPAAAGHPMRDRDGIYHSAIFGPAGRRVQVILLDTRWFRSPVKVEGKGYRKRCVPDASDAATILGAEQWAWLEKQLKEPADLRVIGSSIQVLATEHRFEKWANFPRELAKLENWLSPELRRQTLLLSGDRHMGEIMRHEGLTEVTSSGLTNAGGGSKKEINPRRIGQRVGRRNFGLIEIDWSADKPTATLSLRGETGEILEKQSWPK